ncbi:XisH family protein [Microseira sp. BLCC-F43]|jgi:tRNA A37 N6-isopentenylltransferase MiaA|uniref:XisH family protein n=1 Tax=Microseira sp. BLCC-F43 TaxID=3153602 RepID=UPI0035B76A82
MPAKDIFHDTVRLALEKDGWFITDDPLYIKVGGTEMYIDLTAEKLIAAQKADRKIAVEIKSFLRESEMTEFHLSLGQFLNNRLAMKQKLPELILYLAIPTDTYDTLFQRQFIQDAVEEYKLKLLVFDASKQEIVLWKD